MKGWGRRKYEDECFYDLVYDAWRSGRDPDAVSRDAYDYCLIEGYEPDEIPLSAVYPKRAETEEPTDPRSAGSDG